VVGQPLGERLVHGTDDVGQVATAAAAFRAAAMATDVVRPEARSWPMESRIMVCSTFLTTEWSKASPAMS
jgi:hypothetical protein